ncbi:MAG: pyridoxal-dependent decarboxylase, partial [Acidobacteriota bacterium]
MTNTELRRGPTRESPPTSVESSTSLTLDPADWGAFRELAHRALDAMIDFQEGARERPVWKTVGADAEELFHEKAPRQGVGAPAVVESMLTAVVPYPTGNFHPRFWGWVCGTGTPTGMLAEMIAAGINTSSGTFNDAATRVEAQVLRWMRDLFDFPETSSGLVTSGGSVANLVALAVARDHSLGHDVPKWGLAAQGGQPVFYASTEIHSSVIKAAQTLGLGRDALRLIPVDSGYRIKIETLAAQIATDRRSGLTPFAVVGNAGSVNTGSIDDLRGLAD